MISQDGTFNLTGIHVTPQLVQAITELFGGTSIAVIALTVFNFFSAVLATVLVAMDNRRFYKTWRVAPSNRVPLSLAIAIAISHLFFMLKAFNGLQSFQTFDPPPGRKLACSIFNETGFWGILPFFGLMPSDLDSSCHVGCAFGDHSNQYLISRTFSSIILTIV
jgi:hypothetical protein